MSGQQQTPPRAASLPRPRLLPLVILLAAVVLSLRLADLWQGVEVLAQEEPAVAEGVPAAALESEPSGDGEAPLDPLRMSETELQLLQDLAARRKELEAREHTLDEREVLLAAAERRIDEKIDRLEGLQATLEGFLGDFDEQEEERFKSLVRIYENMKPREAARILEQLDMTVVLEVIGRMRERNSAPILAQMRPDRAQRVTMQLAQQRELPIER